MLFIACLPNLLTLLRVAVTPVFAFLLIKVPNAGFAALSICLLVIVTDYGDGRLARACNVQTSLGAFLDPLADKLFVLMSFAIFMVFGLLSPLVFVLICVRDGFVTVLRWRCRQRGDLFATALCGKIKTALQFAYIACVLMVWMVRSSGGQPLLCSQVSYADVSCVSFLYGSMVSITVLSGFWYLYAFLRQRA